MASVRREDQLEGGEDLRDRLGTDATHAEHIAKIQERAYTKMNAERRFEPEKLGLGLCEGYDQMGHALSKPHLRSELESRLKE